MITKITKNVIDSEVAIPPGTIIESACSVAPSGFLDCDGSAVSRSTYANLFTAIGTVYGAGDGSTTFNIPDRRANVGRGAGTSVGYTQNVTILQGAKTDDALEAHNHQYTTPGSYDDLVGGNGTSARIQSTGTTSVASGRTANETRVKSLGMKYYIKYQ